MISAPPGKCKQVPTSQRYSPQRKLHRATVRAVAGAGELLGHGLYFHWLETEFELSHDSARNLMLVSESFKRRPGRNLNIDAHGLYALAAPGTPEEAREEAVARGRRRRF
jgi:hypothetical protein